MNAKPLPTDRVAAERREATVLFSDLVGLTALANIDERQEFISAYKDNVATLVRHYGGAAQFLEDSFLAYFGPPKAHEDDVEREIWAGMQSMGMVVRKGVSIKARAGVVTGLTEIGRPVGPAEALENGIVGELPTLIARLVRAAEPNTFVIHISARKFLGNLFEFAEPRDSTGIAIGQIAEIAQIPPEGRQQFRLEVASLIAEFMYAHTRLLEWLPKAVSGRIYRNARMA
jgi:class 3 adenylate cyclase